MLIEIKGKNPNDGTKITLEVKADKIGDLDRSLSVLNYFLFDSGSSGASPIVESEPPQEQPVKEELTAKDLQPPPKPSIDEQLTPKKEEQPTDQSTEVPPFLKIEEIEKLVANGTLTGDKVDRQTFEKMLEEIASHLDHWKGQKVLKGRERKRFVVFKKSLVELSVQQLPKLLKLLEDNVRK